MKYSKSTIHRKFHRLPELAFEDQRHVGPFVIVGPALSRCILKDLSNRSEQVLINPVVRMHRDCYTLQFLCASAPPGPTT